MNMNIQHRWIAIPLIILALVGCKEDKKEVKQNRAAVPQVEKKIILDEVAMMNHLRSLQIVV